MTHTASDIGDTAALHNPGGKSPVLLVCEHASNYIPEQYQDLGLQQEALSSHIAWDPGALAVAKYLSQAIDARLVYSKVSRLLFDCNRPPEAIDAIPVRSERYDIPGNRALDAKAVSERISLFYQPFYRLLEQSIEDNPGIRAMVTVHSFTPVYHGESRAVQLGILHDVDTRLADHMLENAAKYTQLNVARNQPYGPQQGVTHTLKCHALENGLLNVMLEISNELIAEQQGQQDIASMLAKLIADALVAVAGAEI